MICIIYGRTGFLRWICACTDPAQHPRTAGHDLNDLDDLNDTYVDDLYEVCTMAGDTTLYLNIRNVSILKLN